MKGLLVKNEVIFGNKLRRIIQPGHGKEAGFI